MASKSSKKFRRPSVRFRNPDDYALVKKAAALRDISVGKFIVHSAVKEARAEIANNGRT